MIVSSQLFEASGSKDVVEFAISRSKRRSQGPYLCIFLDAGSREAPLAPAAGVQNTPGHEVAGTSTFSLSGPYCCRQARQAAPTLVADDAANGLAECDHHPRQLRRDASGLAGNQAAAAPTDQRACRCAKRADLGRVSRQICPGGPDVTPAVPACAW